MTTAGTPSNTVPVPFVLRVVDRGPRAVPATKSAEREVLRLLRRGGEPRLADLPVQVSLASADSRLIPIGTGHLFALRREALEEATALGLSWAASLPLSGPGFEAALIVPHRVAAPVWSRSEVLKRDDQVHLRGIYTERPLERDICLAGSESKVLLTEAAATFLRRVGGKSVHLTPGVETTTVIDKGDLRPGVVGRLLHR